MLLLLKQSIVHDLHILTTFMLEFSALSAATPADFAVIVSEKS
jgi:hypothetical protein